MQRGWGQATLPTPHPWDFSFENCDLLKGLGVKLVIFKVWTLSNHSCILKNWENTWKLFFFSLRGEGQQWGDTNWCFSWQNICLCSVLFPASLKVLSAQFVAQKSNLFGDPWQMTTRRENSHHPQTHCKSEVPLSCFVSPPPKGHKKKKKQQKKTKNKQTKKTTIGVSFPFSFLRVFSFLKLKVKIPIQAWMVVSILIHACCS